MKMTKLFTHSRLYKQRAVPCPTCKVKAGEYCLTLDKGQEMKTSVHVAREQASGLFRKGHNRPADYGSKRRSSAGRKAWLTRLAHEAERAAVLQANTAPKSEFSTYSDISREKLILTALNIVLDLGAKSVTLSQEGLGEVNVTRMGEKSISLEYTEE